MALALTIISIVLSTLVTVLAETPPLRPASPIAEAQADTEITIYTSRPQRFELALDELELDWRGIPGAKYLDFSSNVLLRPDVTLIEATPHGATLGVSGIATAAQLWTVAAGMEAANRGAEVHLVLYELGHPRHRTTRQLLTRELALLVAEGHAPQAAAVGLGVASISPVPGVPNGYVLTVNDPLSALSVAKALRQRPGVRAAYPLLRRAVGSQR